MVQGSERRTVMGDTVETFQGPHMIRAESEHMLIVGSALNEGQAEVQSTGGYVVNAQKRLHLVAGEALVLTCGDSSIELSPGGVVISGTALRVKASGTATFQSSGPALRLGDTAEMVADSLRIFTKSASLEMDENATLNGKKVYLNHNPSKPTGDSTSSKEETVPFSIPPHRRGLQALHREKVSTHRRKASVRGRHRRRRLGETRRSQGGAPREPRDVARQLSNRPPEGVGDSVDGLGTRNRRCWRADAPKEPRVLRGCRRRHGG